MRKALTKNLLITFLLTALLVCLAAVITVNPHPANAAIDPDLRSANAAETTLDTTVTEHATLSDAWKYANDNSAPSTAVTVKLLADCNISSALIVAENKNIILDLNGKILDRGLTSAIADGYAIKVIGAFTLCDSLTGGSVTGGRNTGSGGGVYMDENSTFNMTGGNIAGNTANQGGGIYSNRNSTFIMTGGNVAQNTSRNSGGGIYANFAKISISSEITANSASTGGGIYIGGGTLSIGSSAKISNNTASYGGGGIYGSSVNPLSMSGGEISFNSANGSGGGGGIACYGTSAFIMSGGIVKGNNSKSNGGGVFYSTGTMAMSGNAAIFENTALSTGGGVLVNCNTFEMSENASITKNTANGRTGSSGGGGIFMSGATVATLNGAVLTDNTAESNGGGILMVDTSSLTINNAAITGNMANSVANKVEGGGSGIHMFSAQATSLTINGGTISASSNYAIYSHYSANKISITKEPTLISDSQKPQIRTASALTFADGLTVTNSYTMQWRGNWAKDTVIVSGCNDLTKFTVTTEKYNKVAVSGGNIVLDLYSVWVSRVISGNYTPLYTDDLVSALKSISPTDISVSVALYGNVTLPEPAEIARYVTLSLDLRGFSITSTGSGNAIEVNGNLTLKDTVGGGTVSSPNGYALSADLGKLTLGSDINLISKIDLSQIYTKNSITLPSNVTLSGEYTVECGNTSTLGIIIVSGAATGFSLTNEGYTAVAEENNLLLYASKAQQPTANTSTFTYNGSEQTYALAESDFYVISDNKRTLAGSQTVTVSLSQYNTWADGSISDVTFNFVIVKAYIEKPTEDTALFTYTGKTQIYNPSGFNSAFMTIDGNRQTNANLPGHTVTVTLDSANCLWTTGDADDVIFDFIIQKAALKVTANAHSIFYGAAPVANGVTYQGFVNGENETVLSGTLGFNYNYSQGNEVGIYQITPKGLTADNYEITFTDGTLTVKELLNVVYLGGTGGDDSHGGGGESDAVSTVNVASGMVAGGGKIIVCGDTAAPTSKTLIEKAVTITNTDGVKTYANAILRTYFPTFLSNVTISHVTWQDVYQSKQCEVGKDVTLTLNTVTVADDLIRFIAARDTGAHLIILNSNLSGKVSYLCNFQTVTLDNSIATALYTKSFATDSGNFILKNGSTLSVSMDINTLTSIGEGNTVQTRKLSGNQLAPVTVKDSATVENGKPITLTSYFKDEPINGLPYLQAANGSLSTDMFTLGSEYFDTFVLIEGNEGTIYAAKRTVSEVVISPNESNAQKGKSQQFTATVNGTYEPGQGVIWTVTGGKPGTSINADGLLTVALDEGLTVLTVTATSVLDETKFGSISVTVIKRNLSEAVIGEVEGMFTYNGSEHKPTVTVTDNGIITTSDYSITYEHNINAGTAKVIITAAKDGNYDGAVSRTFSIGKATQAINTDNVKLNYTYTGQVQTVNSGAAVQDTEQVLTYENNTFLTVMDGNGKVVTIYANETANYNAAAITVTLNVQKANYDMSGVTLLSNTAEYDGKYHSLSVTGTLPTGADGIALTVSYVGQAKDTKDGAVNVTATFASASENYNIPQAMTSSISITPKTAELLWSEALNLIYDKTAKIASAGVSNMIAGDSCAVTVALTAGKDNINVGKFTFTAISLSNGNYRLPTDITSSEYEIKPKQLTEDMVSQITGTFTYNGSEHKPTVQVTDSVVSLGDYEINYSANIDAGEAAVTVTAKGNFTGEVVRKFIIAKAQADMNGISLEDKTVIYNGTAFGISITGTLPEYINVTYSESKTEVGIYTITATFATNGNYLEIANMSATLTIRYDKQELPGGSGEEDKVIVESPEGIDPNYRLDAKDVTESYTPAKNYKDIVGKNNEIKQVYDIKLLNNENVAVQPDGALTIRLFLSGSVRDLTDLKIYAIDGETLTEINATRDGNYIVFTTTQLLEYAIVGQSLSNAPSATIIVIICICGVSLLLFIIFFIIILKKKRAKKDEQPSDEQPKQ